MFPIIVGIINFALGSLLNKGVNVVRKMAANKLKDGDAMDEDWRAKIANDLHDIKTKLDGLSRKDLLASRCFLEEGIDLLLLALDEMKDEETTEDEANGVRNVESTTTTETTTTASTMTVAPPPTTTPTSATATTTNENKSVDLNEAIALVHAVQKLKNTSSNRLVSAKECFKAAREEATRAFCNEALKLTDRIMAAKLRVVCKILECLQDTKAAISGCMLFLKELHLLPGIRKTFSTYFDHRLSTYFKSKFYKDSRLDDVKSVLSLNFAVSEFVAKFSCELPDVRNWPRIHLSTSLKSINPLLLVNDVIRQVFGDEEFQPPENHVTPKKKTLWRCCINSKGEIIALFWDKLDHVFILKRSGELKTFCHLRRATAHLKNERQIVDGLAVDFYDNVYLIMNFSFEDYNRELVLFVFDSNGNEKSENVLHFIEYSYFIVVNNCVVNRDGDVIIHLNDCNFLFVCDSNGNLKSRLSLELCLYSKLQCVTEKNEVIMFEVKLLHSDVVIYSKEGKLKRTIDLTSYRQPRAVTYNSVTSQIEILVKHYILSYSERDDVEHLYLPVTKELWYPTMVSHPAGPAAFVYNCCDISYNSFRSFGYTDPKIIFM